MLIDGPLRDNNGLAWMPVGLHEQATRLGRQYGVDIVDSYAIKSRPPVAELWLEGLETENALVMSRLPGPAEVPSMMTRIDLGMYYEAFVETLQRACIDYVRQTCKYSLGKD